MSSTTYYKYLHMLCIRHQIPTRQRAPRKPGLLDESDVPEEVDLTERQMEAKLIKRGVRLPPLFALSSSTESDSTSGSLAFGTENTQRLVREHIQRSTVTIQAAITKFTDKSIYQSVQHALKRKTPPSVQLLLARQDISRVTTKYLDTLKKMGATIRTIEGPQKLSTRFVLFDGKRVLISSSSWEKAARNGEVGIDLSVKIEDSAAVEQTKEIFDILWKQGMEWNSE